MIIRSESDNKRSAGKIIFLVAFTLNTVISYSQIQDFDINVQYIQITETSVSFRYTVKNNTGNIMWLLTYSGRQLFEREGNTLFIAPVYGSWCSEDGYEYESFGFDPYFEVNVMQLNPGAVINTWYYYEKEDYYGQDGYLFYNYSDAEFIDLTLVLINTNIKNPIHQTEYRDLLKERAVLVKKVFEIN